MCELEAVWRTPEERVAQEGFGVVARIADQGCERRKRESLAQHRRGLDGAPVGGCEQIGAGEDNALDRVWQLAVDKIVSGPEKLFKKEWIAASALDAFRGEILCRGKAVGDSLRLG